MPLDLPIVNEGKQEEQSVLWLYDSKALQAMQYGIDEELTITIRAKLVEKEENSRNSVMPRKVARFEVKVVDIEQPLRSKLKNEAF